MTTPSEAASLVTVAIPALNEERYLSACLESLAAGDYPADMLEVLVLDGGSTDASVEIAESWKDRLPGLRVVENPAKIQAAALNIALKQAKGDYFVRLDAHSTYRPDYVSTCVAALAEDRAENVGGIQWPVGKTLIQRIIALTLRSPFSMGPSAHRHSRSAQYAESVYLGAWKTQTLRDLGGFDESLKVAEDYELNIRLRRSDGRVLVDPALRCPYQVRPGLRSLAKQYFRYGLWRTRILRRDPRSMRPRQSAPGLLLLGLLGSLVLVPFLWQVAVIVPLLYALPLLIAVAALTVSERNVMALTGVIVFPVIHLGYGAGFLWGLMAGGVLPRLPDDVAE